MRLTRIPAIFLGILIVSASAQDLLCAPVQAAMPAAATALGASSGPLDAPVSILVFSDYECPFSGQLYSQMRALRNRYPAQLRIVIKQSPLRIHPGSPLAHEAALAAGAQSKFDAMSELLFSHQSKLDRASLLAYASQLHLNLTSFRHALDAHLYRPEVENDLAEARAFGIDSTPTIFLNGHRLDGAQSLEILDRSVTSELAKANIAFRPDPLPAAAVKATSSDEADNADLTPALLTELTESAVLIRGPRSAPVTIVEFSDFQCPFCQRSVKPLEDLLAQRPAQVRLVFRNFPLDFHQYSQLAHEAAYAAGAQGKFWQMHDLIFANQSRLERADLVSYATQLHLDLTAFTRSLDTHTYAPQIAADRALGARLNVGGTPTFFVNGKRITGARSLVELEQLVDEQARLVLMPQSQQAQAIPAPPPQDTDYLVLGSDSSPIRISWFADVRSPLALPAAAILRRLADAYPGLLRIQFKTLQLANHSDSELAGRALLAAGFQQKFWPMYQALAAHAASAGLPPQSLIDRNSLMLAAASLGLNIPEFQAKLDDAATGDSIERDNAEEYRRSIAGSPVVFIENVRIDGLQSERVYRAAIDSAINAAAAARNPSQTAQR